MIALDLIHPSDADIPMLRPIPADATPAYLAERYRVVAAIHAAVARGLAPVLVRLTNERLTAEQVEKEEAA